MVSALNDWHLNTVEDRCHEPVDFPAYVGARAGGGAGENPLDSGAGCPGCLRFAAAAAGKGFASAEGEFHERFLWLDDQPAVGLQALAQVQGWTLVEQPAGDLGERMRLIATLGLAESDAVVLIGNDCPALDGAYLQAACAALQEQSVVIGPAEDGGYVLLGLRNIDVALFNDMPWGTEQVLSMTLQRLQQLDWCPVLLPELWDVDRPEDLSRLAALNIRL